MESGDFTGLEIEFQKMNSTNGIAVNIYFQAPFYVIFKGELLNTSHGSSYSMAGSETYVRFCCVYENYWSVIDSY